MDLGVRVEAREQPNYCYSGISHFFFFLRENLSLPFSGKLRLLPVSSTSLTLRLWLQVFGDQTKSSCEQGKYINDWAISLVFYY